MSNGVEGAVGAVTNRSDPRCHSREDLQNESFKDFAEAKTGFRPRLYLVLVLSCLVGSNRL